MFPLTTALRLASKNPILPLPDKHGMKITNNPIGFHMKGMLVLRADNSAAWIPSHIKSLSAEITLKKSNVRVGQGELSGAWIPAKKRNKLKIPLKFSHKSLNTTGDTTQKAFTDSCSRKCACLLTDKGTTRPSVYLLTALDLGVKLRIDIYGMSGSRETNTYISDLECPFELPY